MAKWYGKIGYSETVDDGTGKWIPRETVREYYGDVMRNTNRWTTNSESINDDLTITSQISIVSDSFAIDNTYSMKWIEFMGTKWKITSVELQFPRLLLTLGGVYNG